MTRHLLLGFTSLLSCLHAQEVSDLLRFGNGDQLHGRFEGISQGPSLVWKRDDLGESAKFGIKELRHLVLRGGHPATPLKSIALVELVNGDQIPGNVTAFNDKEITIDTSCAGEITIERNKVARIAPQPLGGRLHYHGPFSTEPWEVISYNPDRVEQQQQQQENKVIEIQQLRGGIHIDGLNIDIDAADEEQPKDDHGPELDWRHSGAAWYWKSSQPGTALILRDMMPRRSTLRFDVAWKNQLNMAIAFHADFCVDKKPEKPAAENEADQQAAENGQGQAELPRFVPHDSSSLPSIFGNAFILQLHSNYMVIYRSVVDDKGEKSVKRVHTSSRLQIGENSTSTFELRSDLDNSTYSLFVDGKYVTQWTDPGQRIENIKPLEGGSLAFIPQVPNAQVKISDVIIAEWNGMPDSARSMQTEDQDIIVMTNGLDRLAGKALSLEDNQMLRFKGKHGEFLLPLDEISELRMARKGLIEAPEPSGQLLKVRFSPMGSLTGTPLSGDRKTTVLSHPLAGDITISNDAAVMFEFDENNELFLDWDANF